MFFTSQTIGFYNGGWWNFSTKSFEVHGLRQCKQAPRGILSARFGIWTPTSVNTKSWTCSTSFNTWEFIDGTVFDWFWLYLYHSNMFLEHSFNSMLVYRFTEYCPPSNIRTTTHQTTSLAFSGSAETHSVPHFFSFIWSWRNAWELAPQTTRRQPSAKPAPRVDLEV